jgi:hypothetical protein
MANILGVHTLDRLSKLIVKDLKILIKSRVLNVLLFLVDGVQ